MKKISLFIGNYYKFGGEQQISVILANLLAENPDYEITVVSVFKTSDTPMYKFHSRIKFENIFAGQFPPKKNPVKFFMGCRKFFKRFEPQDLIIAWTSYSVFYSKLLPRGTKSIYWDHQGFTVGKKFGLAWLGRRIAAKSADAIVCITQASLNAYKKYIKNKSSVECIYHGINSDLAVSAYNFESKEIISCGRLAHQKGFDMLADVADAVFKKHPDWSWHIYGDGEMRESLEAKIANCGLSEKVILKGYASNVSEIYPQYSFFVMTSRYEGFGLVLCEAMAGRLPLVAFDVESGPKELIDDNSNGFLVPPFNTEQMAEKICELIENPALRKSFSDASAKKFENFSLEAFSSKWNALISSVLSK